MLTQPVYDINHFMGEHQRLVFLTANLDRLKGLRAAPFWCFLVLEPWLHWFRRSLQALGALLAVGVLWFCLLTAYYDRRFGKVSPNRIMVDVSPVRPRVRLAVALVILAIDAVLFFLPKPLRNPETDTLFISAIFLAMNGLSDSNVPLRRFYYLVAGVLMLAWLFSIVLLGAPRGSFLDTYALTFVGAAWLAAAVLDHLMLVFLSRGTMPEETPSFPEVNRMVHEPARLAILTVLSNCTSADFLFLQRVTGLSKGNLSVQISRLEEAGLVHVEKRIRRKKTWTTVALVKQGQKDLADYWRTMDDIRGKGLATVTR